MIHFITPLYRYANLEIIYSNIYHNLNTWKWHLIEGSEALTYGKFDMIYHDSRVVFYKIKTEFKWGHEQRNYFISNIIAHDDDWCYFLDDDNIITQDLIDEYNSLENNDYDLILFSQKKGLTEIIRLYGYESSLKLGCCDIGSFLIKYRLLKTQLIPYISERNADGHYAEHLNQIKNNYKYKFLPDKFVRYNALSFNIT